MKTYLSRSLLSLIFALFIFASPAHSMTPQSDPTQRGCLTNVRQKLSGLFQALQSKITSCFTGTNRSKALSLCLPAVATGLSFALSQLVGLTGFDTSLSIAISTPGITLLMLYFVPPPEDEHDSKQAVMTGRDAGVFSYGASVGMIFFTSSIIGPYSNIAGTKAFIHTLLDSRVLTKLLPMSLVIFVLSKNEIKKLMALSSCKMPDFLKIS